MLMTIEQIREAVSRTREARERVLQRRSTDTVIRALAQTAKNWLEPTSPWRQRAVERAPQYTGFSEAMVSEAIDLTFGAITEQALRELLDGELGDRRVLDGFAARSIRPGRGREAAPTNREGVRRRRAVGPKLIAHFLAGNVPPPGIVSICCGLLLKSANLVKISSRDPVFPALFVESLRAVDAELADCVAVLDWRRDEPALTEAALAEADAVIAYGDDETIAALRRMTRPDARFLGYGHKLSFAVIAKEALTKENLPSLAEAAAFDASVYDQQGCLSPHAFYVEKDGRVTAREFAAALADAMAAYQARVPRGQLSVEEAAQIAKLRGAYEFRSAADNTVAVWPGAGTGTDPTNPVLTLRRGEATAPYHGFGRAGWLSPPSDKVYETPSNAWLVIYEEDPMFTPSCLNRVVFVKPVNQLESIPQLMRRFAPHLSTVGIASMNERAMAFARDLAKMGVCRVCPIGRMQRPPLSWHHDGGPNLADLMRWVDAG